MGPLLLNGLRYGLPAVLILTGIVILCVRLDTTGLEGAALFAGAGVSVLLLNLLFRLGSHGDRERLEEDAAREYFDRHGKWPGED
jgi:high-affinity Fe2+/Pb2+ permease